MGSGIGRSFFHFSTLGFSFPYPHLLANSWAPFGETWRGWKEDESWENRKGLIYISAIVSWLRALWAWLVRIANSFSQNILSWSLQRFPGQPLWWHFLWCGWMHLISRPQLATSLTSPKNLKFTSNFLLLEILQPSVLSFMDMKRPHRNVSPKWLISGAQIFVGLANFGSSGLLPVQPPLALLTQGYLNFLRH